MNSIVNVLGFGLITLTLSGCSSLGLFGEQVKPIEVTTKPIERPTLTLPSVDKVNMRDVEWILITENNVDEVLAEIGETGRPVAFFALTDEGYENLGLNFSDIRALVQQQQTIIRAYQNYYQEAEQQFDNQESK
jgi:hypothetical protein